MSRPRRVGLPWYEPDQYNDLRSRLADGSRLPPDYETWREATEQVEGEVQRSGVEVVRVLIKPAAFSAWCAQHGIETDAAARARYASEFLTAWGDSWILTCYRKRRRWQAAVDPFWGLGHLVRSN